MLRSPNMWIGQYHKLQQLKWMNEWCFRPQSCTKAIMGWRQPGLMRWILVWIMPKMQDSLLDLLTGSPTVLPLYSLSNWLHHLPSYRWFLPTQLESSTSPSSGSCSCLSTQHCLKYTQNKSKGLSHILWGKDKKFLVKSNLYGKSANDNGLYIAYDLPFFRSSSRMVIIASGFNFPVWWQLRYTRDNLNLKWYVNFHTTLHMHTHPCIHTQQYTCNILITSGNNKS